MFQSIGCYRAGRKAHISCNLEAMCKRPMIIQGPAMVYVAPSIFYMPTKIHTDQHKS